MESSKKQIRWAVFLVPWILAVITIALNFISGEAFNAAIMTITNFILDDFSWLFALMSFAFKGWFERAGGAVAGGVRWGLEFLVLLLVLSFVPSSALQRSILLESATGRNIMPKVIDFYNVLSEKAGTMAAEVPVGVQVPTLVMPPVEGEGGSW